MALPGKSQAAGAKALALSAAGPIVVAATALAGVRVYTGLLGRAEFGLAMVATGVVALLDGLVVTALNQTLLALCAGAEDREKQRQIATRLGWLLFRPLAAALVALALTVGAVALFLPVPALALVAPPLALIYLGEEIAKTTMLSPMMARRDYAGVSLWTSGEAIATLLVTAATLAFFRADALGFLIGFVAGRLTATLAFTALFSGFRAFAGATQAPAPQDRTKALSYGLPVSAMAPLGWISAFLDRYALSAVAGLAAAGAYSAAGGLVARPFSIATAILTNTFRPLLFHRPEAPDFLAQTRRRLGQWLATASLVGLAGVVALALLGKYVVLIALAPAFRAGAAPIMTILALAQTFAIMTHAVDNAVLATGASASLLKLQATIVFVALVLAPAGAWWGGGLGAALGRAAAEAVKFAATLALSRRVLAPPAIVLAPA
jgi:O-antigen/teichoic acid export membrane protein